MTNPLATGLRATTLGTTALCLMSGMALADQVFLDDVIISGGGLCVGVDCVNGESFGSDTLRLKENNLRIHFDDTSNSGSFPGNDWRIIANDTTSGGASYLGIEDSTAGRIPFRVEAGAPANALYVADGGRVGFGTATPVVNLHVVGGNSPTLRLEQDGSSGFTPQTWDIASNEANFFIRDATNGSRLPFRIKPSAPTNSLYIDSNGDVGMGAGTAPTAPLHIKRTSGTAALHISDTGGSGPLQMLKLENDGAVQLFMNNTTNAAAQWMFSAGQNMLLVPGTVPANAVFDLAANGNLTITGALTQSSDKNAKMAIEPVDADAILAKVTALPVSSWTYKHDAASGIRHIGPMAQDFYAAFGTGETDTGISSLDTTGVALAAIKALNVRTAALADENADLRARLDALEGRTAD